MSGNQSRLTVVPLPLDEANAFVAQHHRHHRPTVGHKFSIGVAGGEGARLPPPHHVHAEHRAGHQPARGRLEVAR